MDLASVKSTYNGVMPSAHSANKGSCTKVTGPKTTAKIIEAVLSGESQVVVGDRFNLSQSAVCKIMKKHREA